MQVVLKKDVSKIGARGDILKVKPGYFRNFLHPRNLAEVATPARVKSFEELLKQRAIEKERLVKEAKGIIKKFEGVELLFKKKSSSKGKLYGSITEKDVMEAVLDQVKVEIGQENVKMEHIKTEGDHEIVIKLAEGVQTKVKVKVEKEV